MHKDSRSDSEIVKEILDTNQELFAILVRRYQQSIHRYVSFLVTLPEMVDDVVQETFIHAFQNLRSFDQQRKFSTWIFRIAHNQAMSHLRGRWRIESLFADFEFPDLKSDSVAVEFDSELLKNAIHTCLQQLPLKYQEPIMLHFIEEKSYQEIAEITRVPMGTVSIRILRAKQRLAKLCQKKI